MLQHTALASSLIVAAVMISGQASAGDIDFCSGSNTCTESHNGVFCNSSSATIERVKVHQEAKHECPSIEKKHTGNMAMDDHFRLTLNADCSYNFSVETTSGCTGDKSIKVTLSDNEARKTAVQMIGACGTLGMTVTNMDNYDGC